MAMDFSKSKNNILNEVIKKDTEDGNVKVIKSLPLEEIEENPLNERIFNMDEIDQMAETIRNEGFTGSILVIDKPNGKYQIFSGHRRYRAAKKLGMKTIPCTIEHCDSDTMLTRKLLSSNLQTRKMHPLDYARAIEVYKNVLKEEEFKGDTRAEVARFFNTSESQVYRYTLISKMIIRLQEMTNDSEFPYTAFQDAVGLDENQQNELADRIDYYVNAHPGLGVPSVMIKQAIEAIKADAETKAKIAEAKIIEEKLMQQAIQEESEKPSTKDSSQEQSAEEIEEYDESESEHDNINKSREIFPETFESNMKKDDYVESLIKHGENGNDSKEVKLTLSQIKQERDALLQSNIDFDIVKYANLLNEATTEEFTISDSPDIRKAINQLEETLKKLKSKIQ